MKVAGITSQLFPGLRERFLTSGISFIAASYDGGYGARRVIDEPYGCDSVGRYLMEVPPEDWWRVARIATFLLASHFPDWDQEEGAKGCSYGI